MAGESHPSRLRASISSLVTVSASRLPNFTFPSLPVRQWVLISHRKPARAPRPGILTFSTPRPAKLTHPDREYFPPVGCWREPPGHTTCLSVFTCPTQRVLISRWTPVRAPRPDNLTFQTCCSTRLTRPTRRFRNHSRTSARALPARQSYLFKSTLDKAYPSDTAFLKPQSDVGESLPARQSHFSKPVGCRLSIPTKTLPFRLHLSDTVSLDLPSVAGESTPGQTTLPFLVPRWRRLPVQHSGYCAPVGRRREPHSETTYRFPLGRRD